MARGCLGQRAQATTDGLTTAHPVELSFRNIQSQLKNLPTPVLPVPSKYLEFPACRNGNAPWPGRTCP
jgi:hypothetical protein